MRYHWGLGIGHEYSHGKAQSQEGSSDDSDEDEGSDAEDGQSMAAVIQLVPLLISVPVLQIEADSGNEEDDTAESHESELNDEYVEYDSAESDFTDGRDSDWDDDEYLELLDTYGPD